MTKLKHIAVSVAAVLGLLASSCNSDTLSSESLTIDYASVAVTSFKLQADADVLNNLDSVFFAIDLISARIYNADSLPVGTDISNLKVTISSDDCSAIKFYVTKNDKDTILNYVDNNNIELDFSNGPLRMLVVSQDGTNERDYYVNVNVHNVVPDSLYWDQLAVRRLPSTLSNITAQKTVKFNDKAYCLSTDGHSYSLGISENPYFSRWNTGDITLPKAVDLRSFTATESALFILGTDGDLLTSSDGITWSSTGNTWKAITAGYKDRLLGLTVNNGTYYHTEYPGGTGAAASEAFPLSGMSAPVEFSTIWATNPMIFIAGGRTISGKLSGTTWAFDGNSWTTISSGLEPAEGYAIVKYPICETDTNTWVTNISDVMLAFGGQSDAGVRRDVMLSRDMGITWKTGDEFLQLPDYVPGLAFADAVVIDNTFTTGTRAQAAGRANDGWAPLPAPAMPFWLRGTGCKSRYVAPITEWECPFIYLAGGVEADGTFSPNIWRGVVNHFSFIPIY